MVIATPWISKGRPNFTEPHPLTTTMKTTISSIALTLGLLVSNAPAAPGGGGNTPKKKASPEKVFKKKDRDHDSLLSKNEFVHGAKDTAARDQAFGKKDKNGDGKLTLSEFKGDAKKKTKKKTK
jgi:hypothetical protein